MRVLLANGTTGWAAEKFLVAGPSQAPAASASTAIPDNAWLSFHFVDVGQGAGIWIHTFDDGISVRGLAQSFWRLVDRAEKEGDPNQSKAPARPVPNGARRTAACA
jgi:hypothetical protein